MKPKGYLLFHLNLAFSSIEVENRPEVIRRCYWPLLELIESSGIPIGIELTGWTLRQIQKIDSAWVDKFKSYLKDNKCELIGSGYCQIIAPLVPYEVNIWNQRLGLEEYQAILEIRPNIVLVNEMAYSKSLVDIYYECGYTGFIMDRDNVRLAINIEDKSMLEVPTYAKGVQGVELPVLWADSILFQKLQHYAHGDISQIDYLSYLEGRVKSGETLLPIYCNDAEVFDYRPGRFSVERDIHSQGEWSRIEVLLEEITNNLGMHWVSPTQALDFAVGDSEKCKASSLTTLAYPIPVKKQGKYNIARWAVTGRDDVWVNTMCHRISQKMLEIDEKSKKNWQEVCELWASDLRTHITQNRWKKAKKRVLFYLDNYGLSREFSSFLPANGIKIERKNICGAHGGFYIENKNEGILLKISTKHLQVVLNLRRGMTIRKIEFSSHNGKACVGTLPHGFFSSILLGADYYSGGVIVELPKEQKRITDLEVVAPDIYLLDNGDLLVSAKIDTSLGIICKTILVSSREQNVLLSYEFPQWSRPMGSLRLGNITFMTEFIKNASISCCNGGKFLEEFNLEAPIDHGVSSSTMVSSSRGLGGTNGKIIIKNSEGKGVQLDWLPSDIAVMPLLQYDPNSQDGNGLCRIYFSGAEMDDTTKEGGTLGSFKLNISAT